MITFFTVPKPFQGEFAFIQNQTIDNWKHLPCDKQVLLFDQDVRTTSQGTPLLNDVFSQAAEKARYDILIYANADILFTADLVRWTQFIRSKFGRFLMVGQRTDVPSIHLDRRQISQWDALLTETARKHGKLHPPSGIDYFVLKRDMVKEIQMPSFAVGRPAWDNWLIARCLELGYPVVDATRHVLAVHQNHSFSHLHGGRKESRHGIEAQENIRLAGDKLKTIEDATHCLEDLL